MFRSRFLVCLLTVGWLVGGSTALHAEETDSSIDARSETDGRIPASRGISSTEDDEDSEYNFSWLDPDKKVFVLQNRKYRKAMRFGIFGAGGINVNNPYRTEYPLIPRAAFWFTEQFGVEFFYAHVLSSESSNFTALKKVSASALPFVRQNKSYYGAVFSWTPWYAKMNFFNKILYFDWSINGGIGQVSTAVNLSNRADLAPNLLAENFFAYVIGLDQKFYLNQHFVVRWDLIGLFYRAKGADFTTVKWHRNFDFTLGLGFLF